MKILTEILKEHMMYRHQLSKLAKADISKTYRGAALGWLWALIKPTVTIFVFWFCFSVGLRRGGKVGEYPFFLWLIAGMCPWFYMQEMIIQGANSIRKYRYLVTKMKFPISIIPTFVSLSKLVINIGIMFIVIIIFIILGFYPDKYFIQLPIYIFLMFLFFTVWGLFSGMLSAISKDFLNLVKSLVNVLFWMSGILYDVHEIESKIIRNILLLNPVTFIANGYRNVFINKTWIWENEMDLVGYVVVLLCFTFLAIWTYKKLRKDIPDVL